MISFRNEQDFNMLIEDQQSNNYYNEIIDEEVTKINIGYSYDSSNKTQKNIKKITNLSQIEQIDEVMASEECSPQDT